MRRTFTLVELMIVVAILSVLAAVAIPFLAEYQLRAKRSEIFVVSDGLDKAVMAYSTETEWGYLGKWPVDPPGKDLVPWTTDPNSSFAKVGFRPDGDVRAQYQFILYPNLFGGMWPVCTLHTKNPPKTAPPPVCQSDWCVTAVSDVDGDGEAATLCHDRVGIGPSAELFLPNNY